MTYSASRISKSSCLAILASCRQFLARGSFRRSIHVTSYLPKSIDKLQEIPSSLLRLSCGKDTELNLVDMGIQLSSEETRQLLISLLPSIRSLWEQTQAGRSLISLLETDTATCLNPAPPSARR